VCWRGRAAGGRLALLSWLIAKKRRFLRNAFPGRDLENVKELAELVQGTRSTSRVWKRSGSWTKGLDGREKSLYWRELSLGSIEAAVMEMGKGFVFRGLRGAKKFGGL
jgi:hypothetical protein